MATFWSSSFVNLSKFALSCANMLKSKLCDGTTCGTLNRVISPGVCGRWFRSSRQIWGIEEFFPPGVLETGEPIPEEVKSGRSWRAGELRQKSNEDLHKLWYVLLKERNMLLTVKCEARRQQVAMPSPQRLDKVKRSMAMIQVVLGERKRAIEAIERLASEKQIVLDPDQMDDEEPKGIIEESKEFDQNSNHVPLTA